ncbi:hypothetical protein RIF29_40519 [Crotalaria pallida]|uniref:Uncharacterized protein n=1 Tax=Crotalaria pallida TaxID=3830 RepID=A0AAN9HQR8_CROPI
MTSNPKSFDAIRSLFIEGLYGGNLAFERLKEDFHKAQVNPATLANTEILLKALLKEEYLDLIKLQQTVAKLEMSRSEDSAVKILREAKEAHANQPHEAYEIEMLLVEMLIYKGDLKKALECKCLEDEPIKDARRPLYKICSSELGRHALSLGSDREYGIVAIFSSERSRSTQPRRPLDLGGLAKLGGDIYSVPGAPPS